jgi:hypothetical protein
VYSGVRFTAPADGVKWWFAIHDVGVVSQELLLAARVLILVTDTQDLLHRFACFQYTRDDVVNLAQDDQAWLR